MEASAVRVVETASDWPQKATDDVPPQPATAKRSALPVTAKGAAPQAIPKDALPTATAKDPQPTAMTTFHPSSLGCRRRPNRPPTTMALPPVSSTTVTRQARRRD